MNRMHPEPNFITYVVKQATLTFHSHLHVVFREYHKFTALSGVRHVILFVLFRYVRVSIAGGNHVRGRGYVQDIFESLHTRQGH